MPTDVALLAEVPFFQLLDERERAALAAELDVVHFSAGDTIFHYGDPGDSLYVIRSGEVEIFVKDDTGERILLETARAGDFFGELSMLDGGPRNASVIATQQVESLRLTRDDLQKFLRLQPSAALDMLAATGRRLRTTAHLLRHTASRNVNKEMEDTRTLVQKSADAIAEFSGSLSFLFIHVVLFFVWIVLNIDWIHTFGWPPLERISGFDPFPFGLLTMAVSLEAIVLSVFVLLSQNRQAAKDRIRSDIEYEVNLKAELEVAHLHEKVDHLKAELGSRLNQIEARLSR
jgi:CRP/FNR family cyclic AMP-dependent transcriptional regulator